MKFTFNKTRIPVFLTVVILSFFIYFPENIYSQTQAFTANSCPLKSSGDADCDGKIGGTDYSIWLNSQCHPSPGQICADLNADFNFDGRTDDADYLIWFANRNNILPTQPVSTPPPPTVGPGPTRGPVSCSQTIATSVATADGAGNFSTVKPGDTVCISAGNRGGLTLINFKGTSSAPITFINHGGIVNISNPSNGIGIQIYGTQHIVLTGTGSSDQYGIQIANASNAGVDTNHIGAGGNLDGSEYLEMDHIFIQSVGGGFRTAKNNDLLNTGIAWSGHQYYIHDNYIKNTTNEAMYIGTSDTQGIFPIYDVEVWHNRIENAGYDGIQVRQAHQKVLVHHNYINGTGSNPCKNGTFDETAGLNIAKLTDTGDWYDNTIINARHGLWINNVRNIRAYNNVVIDSGHATSNLTGACPAPSTPVQGAAQIENAQNIQFMFNTVINTNVNAAYGINIINGSTGSVHDNIVGGTFTNLIAGSGMTLANNLTNGSISFFNFVNPVGGDFHLTSSSPAVNSAGTSIFPAFDFDNFPRPQGPNSDAGAFEFH